MKHFDERAATWDDDPAKLARAQRTAALLREHLPLNGTEQVLDVGGGTGRLSILLADAIADATIADTSTGMIEAATQKIDAAGLSDRFRAVLLDLTVDDLPEERFDGAWSQLVLHHVRDVDLLLHRVREVLKPGAWFAVVDLDQDADGAFHAHLREHHDGHDSHQDEEFLVHDGFDRHSFGERMRAAGFERVTVHDGGVVRKEAGNQDRDFPMFLAIGHHSAD
ncbi:class I SAM-dependent methyltransferase [Enemella dayhoffiae]|uniref:class I SAM-dependent methyltransferase n=1 Tax=Enemella dayhoffiae TaxID=2016507 RepID=UPI0015951B7C|nr:class I SAM-dependent methyltransferase [Enemella dayhoffiae]